MVQYYDRFISGLVITCAVLYDMLQKNFKWKWTTKHTKAIEVVKASLMSTDTQTHYDLSLLLSLPYDARGLLQ